jgi:hypothetical protein
MIKTYRMKGSPKLMDLIWRGGYIGPDYANIESAVDTVGGYSMKGKLAGESPFFPVVLHLYEFDVLRRGPWFTGIMDKFGAEEIPCHHNYPMESSVKLKENYYATVCSNCGGAVYRTQKEKKELGIRLIRFKGGNK